MKISKIKPLLAVFLALLLLTGCQKAVNEKYNGDLAKARENFNTELTNKWTDNESVDIPPKALDIIEYQSPVGMLSAYITPDPEDNVKHPAIIWIFGGFGNSIGSTAWDTAEPDNDQSASVFRKNGIVTMYPSFRGGNYNQGYQEYFLGEIDDVIAAAEYLKSLPYVDPDRIYLGGHSTGGTVALLTAECTENLFRAVFSFGPIDTVINYGVKLPFDDYNQDEIIMRSPIFWLGNVQCLTFVIEGERGNSHALSSMRTASKNKNINFRSISGYDHFSVLKPGCDIIAEKILADKDEVSNITISDWEF